MLEISVIMSVYNESIEWLEESIDSVLNQTFTKFEFIIINDNPENETLSLYLKNQTLKDSRIKLIENKENIGLTASLNKALNIAKGTYIARMDADDVSLPERLQIQKEHLELQKLDFIYTNVHIMDEEGILVSKGEELAIHNSELIKLMKYGNSSKHPTWFLKKSVYDDLKGYRDVPFTEDYDFVLRALLQGYKVEQISPISLNYRYRESSISRSNAFYQYKITSLLKKMYRKNTLNDDEKMEKEVSKILSTSDTRVASNYSKFIIERDNGITLMKNNKKALGIFYVIKSCLFNLEVLRNTFEILLYKVNKKRI